MHSPKTLSLTTRNTLEIFAALAMTPTMNEEYDSSGRFTVNAIIVSVVSADVFIFIDPTVFGPLWELLDSFVALAVFIVVILVPVVPVDSFDVAVAASDLFGGPIVPDDVFDAVPNTATEAVVAEGPNTTEYGFEQTIRTRCGARTEEGVVVVTVVVAGVTADRTVVVVPFLIVTTEELTVVLRIIKLAVVTFTVVVNLVGVIVWKATVVAVFVAVVKPLVVVARDAAVLAKTFVVLFEDENTKVIDGALELLLAAAVDAPELLDIDCVVGLGVDVV